MSAAAIHQGHENLVQGFRDSVRVYAPFTFIAYKSVVPSAEDDLIELAAKICDIASLSFIVNLVAAAVHPIFILIPYIPLMLDMGRMIYCWITGTDLGEVEAEDLVAEHRSPFRRIAALAFLALGLAGVYTAHEGNLFADA
jgi:hypothetical protein